MSDETRKAAGARDAGFPAAARATARTPRLNEQFGAPRAGRGRTSRSETKQGAVARPGGATQNSGGALVSNDAGAGPRPGAGARPGSRRGLIGVRRGLYLQAVRPFYAFM